MYIPRVAETIRQNLKMGNSVYKAYLPILRPGLAGFTFGATMTPKLPPRKAESHVEDKYYEPAHFEIPAADTGTELGDFNFSSWQSMVALAVVALVLWRWIKKHK